MSITYSEQFYKILKNTTPFEVYKQRNQNIGAGQWSWTWNNNSIPPQGANPAGTTPVVLSRSSTGAIPFVDPTSPQKAYLAELTASINNQYFQVYELHDYFVHMNGLVCDITTTQTISGFDLQTLASTSNLAQRYGASDYSEVQWWAVWYAQAGPVAVDYTINVTYNDGTTGDLGVFQPGGTTRGGRMFPINGLIPASAAGKCIRGINSVTLSASTTGTGNFGFTATRYIGSVKTISGWDKPIKADWSATGLEQIYPNSCLSIITQGGGVNSSFAKVKGKIVYG